MTAGKAHVQHPSSPRSQLIPLTLTVDHGHRRACFVGTDPIKPADVLQALRQQVAAAAWTYPALVDLKATQSWIPSTETIEGALTTAQTLGQRLGPRGRSPWSPAATSHCCGMLRMHSAQAKTIGLTSQVFTSTALAMEWLGSQ